MDIPLFGYGVESRSLHLSPQLLKNLYPTVHPNQKSYASLVFTPGLMAFADPGLSPVRGLHEMAGVLYAVVGDRLYSVSSSGGTSSLGSVPGSGLVSMDDNGYQLAIAAGNAYVYNKDTSAFSQVALPDDAQTRSCVFVGQYMLYQHETTGEVFVSDFNDAATVQPLSFVTAESAPDNLLALRRLNGNAWLLGEHSIEGWYVSDEAVPLNPIPGAAYDVGGIARFSFAGSKRSLYWLSDDRRVYSTVGAAPLPVSNEDVDAQIAKMTIVDDAVAFCYEEEGHSFYVLSFTAENRTFVFDETIGEWHQRTSGEDRFLGNAHAFAYGKNFVGHRSDGDIYDMSLSHYDENGSAIIREGITPFIPAQDVREVEILANTGIAPLNATDADVELRWLLDGRTWGDWVPTAYGNQGEYDVRLRWPGLGFRQDMTAFHYRVSMSAPGRLMGMRAR